MIQRLFSFKKSNVLFNQTDPYLNKTHYLNIHSIMLNSATFDQSRRQPLPHLAGNFFQEISVFKHLFSAPAVQTYV